MLVHTIVGAVMLFSAHCPDPSVGPDRLGCVYPWQATPSIYISPKANGTMRRWTWQHELGHIVQYRTPGAPLGERFAQQFAACHTQYSWSLMLGMGFPGRRGPLRQMCAGLGWPR
jgi:hypothetical protein